MKKLPENWKALVRDQYRGQDVKTAMWVVFWLTVLTAGEPDLLSAVVGWIGRL
jgi:hypothetical protein